VGVESWNGRLGLAQYRYGAYKEESAVGCGGVIRHSNGVWRGGFAKNMDLCSDYVVELWGVLQQD
jgi:hypothetical protein